MCHFIELGQYILRGIRWIFKKAWMIGNIVKPKLMNLWHSGDFFIWAVFLFGLFSFFLTVQYQNASDNMNRLGLNFINFDGRFNSLEATKGHAEVINLLSQNFNLTQNYYPKLTYIKYLDLSRMAGRFPKEPQDPNKIKTLNDVFSNSEKSFLIDMLSFRNELLRNYVYYTDEQKAWYKILTYTQIIGLFCAGRLAWIQTKLSKKDLKVQNETNKPS